MKNNYWKYSQGQWLTHSHWTAGKKLRCPQCREWLEASDQGCDQSNYERWIRSCNCGAVLALSWPQDNKSWFKNK